MRLALYSVLILSTIGGIFFTFKYIKNIGQDEVKLEVVVNNNKALKNYEKAKQKNNSSDDIDLIKRYCRWVYGATYDECVSSYKPVDRE